MDFSVLYNSAGNFKTQHLSKVEALDLDLFIYLSQLNDELMSVYNKEYKLYKLISYHKNKILNNTDVKDIIKNNFFTSRGLNSKMLQHNGIFIKINFPYLFDELVKNGKSLENAIYDIYYDIDYIPLCVECNNPVKFGDFKGGYNTFCCVKCSATNIGKRDEPKEKRKQTNVEKYGYEFHLQNPEIRKKMSEKCIEKYGVEWTSQIPEAILKVKQTKLEKYGDENYVNIEKIRQTSLKRYGVESVLQIDWIHERGIIAAASDVTIEKIKQTNLSRHGKTSYLATEDAQKKSEEKFLELYGVTRPFLNPEIRKKIRKIKKKKFHIRYNNLQENLLDKHNLILQKDAPNGMHDDVYCICENGHTFKRLAYLLNNNPYCPYCNKRKKSLGERQIKELLLNHMDENNILTSYRDYENGIESKHSYSEIDLLLVNENIGIEFDGVYWHSERRGKDKNYHLNKTNLCEEKGTQLIHIFEDEWFFKPEISKSVLLSKLGKFDNRIYARKCEVKTISSKIKNTFLDENHLQGKDSSTIKLGLFYNNELVSCMTFGKRMITGKLTLELIRFCNKLNTQVVGGASKLFKYFLKNHWNGEEIISYADRRWSNGNLYNQLGFEFSHKSAPSYWYIEKGKRIHRSTFMKHKLPGLLKEFNPELTEWENMQMNGYDRIWDCGCLVYKFNQK